MARALKPGFDSFEVSVGLFSDPTVRNLLLNKGPDAVLVLLSIYTVATRFYGYYLPIDSFTLEMVCGDGSGERTQEFVREVIEEAVKLQLFDSTLYREHQVLTSEEFQKTYCTKAKAAKRRKIQLDERYALIAIDEKGNVIEDASEGVDIANLSRMIVQQWNMANASRPGYQVPEDMKDSPIIMDSIRELIKHYPDYRGIDPWFAIIRNAVVERPDLRLPSILCNEPVFRLLFEMGEPANFIPGEFSPPKGYLHPAVIQETRMKRSGYSEEEILEVTSKLLSGQPVTPMPPQNRPEPAPFTSPESIAEALDAPDEPEEVEEPGEPEDSVETPVDETYPDTVTETYPDTVIESQVITTYQDYPASQPVSIPVYITNEATSSVILTDEVGVPVPTPVSTPVSEEEFESPTRTVLPVSDKEPPIEPPTPPTPPTPPKSRGFFAGRNDKIIIDGEEVCSPEEKARRETLQKEQKEVQKAINQASSQNDPKTVSDIYVHEYDPQLSPLLKSILHEFNEQYEKQGYKEMDKLRADEDLLSEEQHALAYLREYIAIDPRFADLSFWKLLVEGLIFLKASVGSSSSPVDPKRFFDVAAPVESLAGEPDMVTRRKHAQMWLRYITDPEHHNNTFLIEPGIRFLKMKEQEASIRQNEKPADTPQQDADETITPEQKAKIEEIRNNPTIEKGDLVWMEDRVIHPELYKDPDKDYGDRSAPLPWAKKNPPSYEEVVSEPDFCHPLSYGNTIQPKNHNLD